MKERAEGIKSLLHAEHLESILYQFVTLYEEWKNDRLVVENQGNELAELVEEFSEQVANFKDIEESVRKEVHDSIRNEAKNTAIYLGNRIGEEAAKEIAPTVKKLIDTVSDAEIILRRYQADYCLDHWKAIGMTVFGSVFTSLLIVWFLMPKPVLPLTNEQVKYLRSGMAMELVWPKLDKKEQDHWVKFEKQFEHPRVNEIDQ